MWQLSIAVILTYNSTNNNDYDNKDSNRKRKKNERPTLKRHDYKNITGLERLAYWQK